MTSFHLAIQGLGHHHLAQACSAYQLDCSRSTNKRTNQRHVRDDVFGNNESTTLPQACQSLLGLEASLLQTGVSP